MTGEVTFFTNPQSRGQIARWMLEEVEADYRTEVLEYGEQIKSPEYLAINPMGKVPAIQHGEDIVTECAAICAYLAEAFPEAGLAPSPDQRAAYYRWLFFAAGPVEAAVTNRSLDIEIPPNRRGRVGYGSFDTMVDTLAEAVSQNSYIAGDTFTAADVYVGSQVGWGLQFEALPPRQEFTDYWQRINDRPAHHRATELDQALLAETTES